MCGWLITANVSQLGECGQVGCSIETINRKTKIKKAMGKIKYDFNCKHYFGIVSAESEEEARKILHKDHTGNGDKLCNWSKTTKNDCQKKCQLTLNKR